MKFVDDDDDDDVQVMRSLLKTVCYQGRIQGEPCPPQDAEVAFWSTAVILIQ